MIDEKQLLHVPGKCNLCGENCLKNIDFLVGLPEDKQFKVIKNSRTHRLHKEEPLFKEGGKVDGIYIVREGKVKLCTYDAEGREQIITIFSAGDTIWEGILMEDSRYPYSAIALEDVRFCKIYKTDLEEAMTDPAIALRVIGLLSQKLHNANERNMLLAVADPKARIAGLLLLRTKYAGTDILTMRLDDIAGSINLRPETISRKIREMDREGVIKKTGQSTIQILDREALNDIYRA